MGLRKLYGFRVEVDLSRFPALSQQVAAAPTGRCPGTRAW